MTKKNPGARFPSGLTVKSTQSLVNAVEDMLLSSVIHNSFRVLRPLFPLSSANGMASVRELIHLPYPPKITNNAFQESYIDSCSHQTRFYNTLNISNLSYTKHLRHSFFV